MFKKKTPEQLDKEFLAAIQKVCKKYKRGLTTQIRVIREEDGPTKKVRSKS